MAVTQSPRLGLTRWGAGTDPLRRAQLDADHAALDDLAAIDVQVATVNDRPAAGTRGRYCFVESEQLVYRDTGAAWVLVGAPPPDLSGYATDQELADGLATKLGLTGKAADADKLDGLEQTAAATPNTIARRDAAGRLGVAFPAADGDAANKAYVDGATSGGAKIASGSYAGNGGYRTIALPFTPKFVALESSSVAYYLSTLSGTYGVRLSSSSVATSSQHAYRPELTTNGFIVSTDPQSNLATNYAGATFYYVAIG